MQDETEDCRFDANEFIPYNRGSAFNFDEGRIGNKRRMERDKDAFIVDRYRVDK